MLKLALVFNLYILPQMTFAAIVVAQGRVEVFQEPSQKTQGSEVVLFEGQKFHSLKARIGTKIFPGQVIRTGPDGKARIIFNNGDQFSVGPATAYVFPAPATAQKPSELNIMYGKVRATIEKDGPRTNLQIKTPVAVAGVRGTDLVMAYNPATEKSEVHVLRGKVEVTSTENPKAKPIQVETGYKTEIFQKVELEIKRSTQVDLLQIQKDSVIKAEAQEIAAVPKEVQIEVASLEKKALETTLKDVQTYTPEVFEKLKKNGEIPKDISVDKVNTEVVSQIYKEAPKGPVKPSRKDLDGTEEDVYQKYFNPQGQ